jgi:hypothetical protein
VSKQKPLALSILLTPGDELLAAPAMLGLLGEAGWDLASIFLPGQASKALGKSHRALGLPMVEPKDPPKLWPTPDEERLQQVISEALGAFNPAVVLSPGAGEGQLAYRSTAQATKAAVESYWRDTYQAPVWWMWSRGTLPDCNLYHQYDQGSLDLTARLSGGEDSLACSRLKLQASLVGLEGSAEAVVESQLFDDMRWRAGRTRCFDQQNPLPAPPASSPDMFHWMDPVRF